MALFFDASTENVLITDASSIQDLANFTYMAWVKDGAGTVANRVWEKGQRGGLLDRLNGNMTVFSARSVGQSFAGATFAQFANYAQGTWMFVGGTVDPVTAANNRLFIGNLTADAAEPGSYDMGQQEGSGTTTTDVGTNLTIGNRPANGRQFEGDIAIFALFNRTFQMDEVIEFQYRPAFRTGCVILMELGVTGVGTQTDLSGNGNDGTVNGATQSTHVPLPRYRQLARF